MDVFEEVRQRGHEQVVFCNKESAGLKAIIAIHDTTLGPALGGLRMWNYETEEDALRDVLRLSEGMTYKNAAMGLNLGGGKAVIIGDPHTDKSEVLFKAFGKFVQSLNGRYITAEDVSITTRDVSIVAEETEFVAGLPGTSGDPSPVTAYGVFHGMKACLKHFYGEEDFSGKTVAVQGLGHVGYNLCRLLHEAGASLIVTDIMEDKVEKVVSDFGARDVAPDDIYGVDADIFAPCALGAVINDDTIDRLQVDIVAGAANNQLAEERHGEMLEDKGILYAPDYVINGGGVINVADEFEVGGYNKERALGKVRKIYDKIERVLEISEEDSLPTYEAADRMAEERIEKISHLNRFYLRR